MTRALDGAGDSDGAFELELDATSLLVGVSARMGVNALEHALGAEGFTLGLNAGFAATNAPLTVGEWLAEGLQGAARLEWADPADHRLAGLTATLPSGVRLEVKPSPRRSVGPDMTALVLGARGAFTTIEYAWLRMFRRDDPRPAGFSLPDGVNLDPALSAQETALVERVRKALRSA